MKPLDETFAHKLALFLPVSEILLFLLGGARLFPLLPCGNDELLAKLVVDEEEEFIDEDPLLKEDSPEKTTWPNDTVFADDWVRRRLLSLPLPKKLVFRFLYCLLR